MVKGQSKNAPSKFHSSIKPATYFHLIIYRHDNERHEQHVLAFAMIRLLPGPREVVV